MDYAGYKTLRFDHADRILTVTIDNGPVNAVDHDLHDELARVFSDIQKDAACDLVILTGQGRAFCAGGDMDWFQEMIDNPSMFRDLGVDAKRIVFDLLELEKPIICRLNGAAAGLGASIALLCDVIIADEKAVIGDPHVKVGLVAGDGGAVIWPQLIGFARAKELLLTGDMVPAPKAEAMGLINYAVPTDQLDAQVDEVVRWTKTAANIPLKTIAHTVMDAAIAYETISNSTQDRQEAVTAFVEKRGPRFTGE